MHLYCGLDSLSDMAQNRPSMSDPEETFWLCRAPGASTEGPYSMTHLRTLAVAGQLGSEPIICRKGTEAWEHWQAEVPATAQKIRRKERTGGSGCAAFIFFILAIVCFVSVVGIPVGLIFLALALLVDAKTAKAYFCGACGNKVSEMSNLCPACQTDLE